MKILVISNSFIFRTILHDLLSRRFEDYKIQSLESITDLLHMDLQNVDCIIADTNDKYIEKLGKIKILYYNIKMIALDLKKNRDMYIKFVKSEIDGYIYDMTDDDEFIYKINRILKGEKYYEKNYPLGSYNKEENNNIEKNVNKLTKREKEILGYVSKGLSNKDISRELYISQHTVKKHISSILGKMGFKNRKDIIIMNYS